MKTPLVTVICLCYNQAFFVEEAIRSVWSQTYSPIQLIVVDDASTDNSKQVITKCLVNTSVQFIALDENAGNCKAFNQALQYAKGEFIIDLAADDVLLPERVAIGVKILEEQTAGVHFTDAEYIDTRGQHLSVHSEKYPHATIPQGMIYKDIISRFFICPPTIMFRKEVIDRMGGYDEELAYEDFDFWIRSSREYRYVYTPNVLVRKRIVGNSMSKRQFSFRSKHHESTWKVCKKILMLNRTAEEKQALDKRLRYEIRLALRMFNFSLAVKFVRLWVDNRTRTYG